MILIRRCSRFKGVIWVERKNNENKLVLVIIATLLSFAAEESREMEQSWVVMWSQMKHLPPPWGFINPPVLKTTQAPVGRKS